MSNYCDPSFYQQNIYTNTYSLWENSAYYDINNLSPQNFSSSWHRGNEEDYETLFTSGPTQSEPPQPPDHRNRRIVDRASLYEDPESFYRNIDNSSTPPLSSEWTQQIWQKPGEGTEGPSKAKGKPRPNKIQKKLDKLLSKPVKMTKAESMMQKMGWHGGALGRSGTGIVEPIAPNAVYASKKSGFGQSHTPQPNSANNTVKNDKDNFTTNVLYTIYEFVKNNSEVELLLDNQLYREERKRIHNIVQFMTNEEKYAVWFKTDEQMDLVLKICDANCYILHTQSEGEGADRRLCIYKEAPSHVYLIIPDDLRDDAKDPEVSDNEAEEETNPFLRSITRNLKKSKDEKTNKPVVTLTKEAKISQKIMDFFTEFGEQKKYTQFKFLGPFEEDELSCIRYFMDKVAKYLDNEPVDAKAVFDKISFEIGEDITGNTVINKRPK